MTVKELAVKSGINAVSIYGYLREHKKGRLPSFDTISRLSAALNCTLAELLGIDEPPSLRDLNNDQKKFLEIYDSLSPEAKETLEKMLLLMVKHQTDKGSGDSE